MPVLSTMGLKKIYIAPATTTGDFPAKGNTWLDLGDVYQDTCTLKDSDPETTTHKSETSGKRIIIVGETDTTVELSLMDPDLEQLSRYFGGTITGTDQARKWTKPRKPTRKEWAIWIQPEEGLFIGCPTAVITPKFDIAYNAKGICLVGLTIHFQAELAIDEAMTDPTTTQGI